MVFVCPKQNVCSWANNCFSTKRPHLEPLCTFQVPTGYSHAVPRQDARAPGTTVGVLRLRIEFGPELNSLHCAPIPCLPNVPGR